MSASATIVLGLSDLTGLAGWGFSLSAMVTLITALEPFFNFRSRWVSADEALAEWHKAEESLAIYVETRAESDLVMGDVVGFDKARRDVWERFSQEWLSDRRSPGSRFTP